MTMNIFVDDYNGYLASLLPQEVDLVYALSNTKYNVNDSDDQCEYFKRDLTSQLLNDQKFDIVSRNGLTLCLLFANSKILVATSDNLDHFEFLLDLLQINIEKIDLERMKKCVDNQT